MVGEWEQLKTGLASAGEGGMGYGLVGRMKSINIRENSEESEQIELGTLIEFELPQKSCRRVLSPNNN